MQDRPEDSSDRKERHSRLTREIVERVMRDLEDGRGFDEMEIARGLVAVACRRLQALEPFAITSMPPRRITK
jgi:hypothetical protein